MAGRSIFNPLPETIHLICNTCGRAGRYSRERYVEIAGTDNGPAALLSFARAVGCDRAIKQGEGWDERCGIVYDNLPHQAGR